MYVCICNSTSVQICFVSVDLLTVVLFDFGFVFVLFFVLFLVLLEFLCQFGLLFVGCLIVFCLQFLILLFFWIISIFVCKIRFCFLILSVFFNLLFSSFLQFFDCCLVGHRYVLHTESSMGVESTHNMRVYA